MKIGEKRQDCVLQVQWEKELQSHEILQVTNRLIMCIETVYLTFIAKYAHMFKYLSSLIVKGHWSCIQKWRFYSMNVCRINEIWMYYVRHVIHQMHTSESHWKIICVLSAYCFMNSVNLDITLFSHTGFCPLISKEVFFRMQPDCITSFVVLQWNGIWNVLLVQFSCFVRPFFLYG